VVPTSEWAWDSTDRQLPLDEIEKYRLRFQQELLPHCETRCLDHVEIDAVGNWRLFFFPLTEDAASILENAATKLSEVHGA
jgi:hypothetical protein